MECFESVVPANFVSNVPTFFWLIINTCTTLKYWFFFKLSFSVYDQWTSSMIFDRHYLRNAGYRHMYKQAYIFNWNELKILIYNLSSFNIGMAKECFWSVVTMVYIYLLICWIFLNYLECWECVWGYIKSRNLHIVKEAVELGREQHYFGKSFVSTTFSQHHPTIQGYLLVLISIAQSHKYIIIQDSCI